MPNTYNQVLNKINKNRLNSNLCFSNTSSLASRSPIAQSTTLENHLLQDENKGPRLFISKKEPPEYSKCGGEGGVQ